jgi:tRNA uridine 5-carbamoylmethylation protein Kti12
MKTLHVMVGLPGTGKSTLINSIIRDMGDHGDRVFVYSTDNLIEEWAAGQGWSYNFAFDKYISKAEHEMNRLLKIAIAESRDIIWDQTNTGLKKRKRIIDTVPKDYVKVCHSISFPQGDSQLSDWEWRLENRPGKAIGWGIIENMKKNYVEPSVDEGFESVYTYDMYGNKR